MAIGAGRYDDLCTYVREQTQAGGVLLIVLDGVRGNGFSCQADLPSTLRIPDMLEHMAKQIRADMEQGKI